MTKKTRSEFTLGTCAHGACIAARMMLYT